MRYLYSSLLIVILAASGAVAATVGVGVSVRSGDTSIYIPVDINNSIRIEPFVRARKSSGDYEHRVGSYAYSSDYEDSYRYYGVGIFGKSSINENSNTYYGARIAYTTGKHEYNSESSNGDYYSGESDLSGYGIAPTLGFEYYITEKFSIGAEAEWYYEKFDSDTKSTSSFGDVETTNEEDKSTGTNTRVSIRLFF